MNPKDTQTVEARFLNQSLDERLALSSETIEAEVLGLFRESAATVPAYRDYLQQRGVVPESIRSLADFGTLPLMTKADYIRAYPLEQRVEGGDLSLLDRIAVSSGSTGEPTFWPRAKIHELAVADRFEQVFKDSFKAHQRKTLAVVCFALGNWVGGLYTTACCWHLSAKGYPLTVATPGNHPDEILRVIRALGPQYEQVVLLGYPPFVRDVVDAGLAAGIDWPALKLKMVFAGEVFSEEWRQALCQKVGAEQPAFATASLYGTADGGVLGNETPFTIAARRFLAQKPEVARQLFGESRLPTLVQFDPKTRYFEVHDGTLVVSGRNGVPLVRYHIADKGGVLSFETFSAFLKEAGAEPDLRLWLGDDPVIRQQPLVYVFGRADFTVSYYGANIFPENVTVGLETPELMRFLTGKFILEVEEGLDGAPGLRITAELRQGEAASPKRTEAVAESIRTELLRLNSEFRTYTPIHRQKPHVQLKPFGDPEDFPLGVKHRYTRKS